MNCYRHRLKHSCLFPCHTLRELYKIPFRYRYIFSESTVPSGAEIAVIRTHFVLFFETLRTFPAWNKRKDPHPFSKLTLIHICPKLFHLSRKLVSYYQRHTVSTIFIDSRNIRTAYSRRLYFYKHFPGFRFGNRHLII